MINKKIDQNLLESAESISDLILGKDRQESFGITENHFNHD